jgi:hypothetical protein
MCGRYMITSSFEAMARLFEAELDLGANMIGDAARPNVSPTEAIPVVVAGDGGRRLVAMRWGLVPPWYKTPTGGPLLINARAESVATKPAFAKAVRDRRCLIPADGFYEWQGEKGAKTPYHPPHRQRPLRLRRPVGKLARPADGGDRHLRGQQHARADSRANARRARSRRLAALARRGRPRRGPPDDACT